ncbi:hypothetical protein BCR32DRAFT_242215 [Anaeromyces robustus]|uniref:TLDc domain-containing protein n=1 Tax=Anaeromyces robustus TaxID=1754192 RepID=A0A1Y1XGJ7_9FUNG|nr:hypothetical protein BCR32DRAFT_242215 [Anaeromyces robustus]|eukprot:ORX84875.1 hypothetical protein BCR32DRAFT_242215 [Anaeromyces robustus]
MSIENSYLIINEEETKLNYLNVVYNITIRYEEEADNYLISIEARKDDEIVNYTYETVMNHEDLERLHTDSSLLRLYDTTEKIYYFILDAIKEEKLSIKKITKSNLILIITSKFLGFSEPHTMEIILKKKECDIHDTVKLLCNKINKLTKENKLLKFKLKHKIFKDENEINFIKDRLCQVKGYNNNKRVNLKLRFRLSENGSRIIDFHNICDDIPNNLVLIKTTEGERFGGFTTLAWTSCNANKKDDNVFCFSLTNCKIYNIIKGYDAIGDFSDCGPTFLNNMFYIGSRYNSLTYGNCSKTTRSNYLGERTTYEINNNKQFFIVIEFEFYEVIYE